MGSVRRSFVAFLVFAFVFLFSFGELFATQPVKIRSTATECGIYLASAANTTLGIKVADYDNPDDFQAFLDQNPELKDQIVYIVGTPVWGKEKKNKKTGVRVALDEAGHEKMEVRTIDKPKGFFQHVRAYFPMKQDMQKITPGEIKAGVTKLSISGTVPIVVLLLTQPPEIAIPVGLVNLIQSAIMTFPRQFWGNWQTRSNHWLERFTKQFWISAVFTFGLYWAAQFGEGFIADPEYAGNLLDILTLGGWAAFLASRWPSAVFQSLWRTPVHNGVYEWVNTRSVTEEANEEARQSAGRIEMAASLITTQFFIYSSIAGEAAKLFHFGFDWNAGHIGMAVMGMIGVAGWLKPKMWDYGSAGINFAWDGVGAVTRAGIRKAKSVGKVTFKMLRDKFSSRVSEQDWIEEGEDWPGEEDFSVEDLPDDLREIEEREAS